jgi:hypothetical protein
VLNGQDYCTTSCGIQEIVNKLGTCTPRTIPTLDEGTQFMSNVFNNAFPVVANLALAKSNWAELKSFWLIGMYSRYKFVQAIHAELIQKYQLVEFGRPGQSPQAPLVRARGGLGSNGRVVFGDSDDEDSRCVLQLPTHC